MILANYYYAKRCSAISTSAQTLDYIGITLEEMDDAYRNLNLGSLTSNYLMDSKIIECDINNAC